jgi:hypothetical protein
MKDTIRRYAIWLSGAVLIITGALAQAQGDSLDPRDFRLSMELVRSYVQASENVYAVLQDDPTLLDDLDEGSEDFGAEPELRAMIATVEATPPVRQAIERAGLSVREYALTNATLIPAFITYQIQMSGLGDGAMFDWITTDHIRFIENNAEAIGESFQRLQDMVPDDEDW